MGNYGEPFRLPFYGELFYSTPENDDQRQINKLLSALCRTSTGSGWEPISAQGKLRALKAMSPEDRESAYSASLAQWKTEQGKQIMTEENHTIEDSESV